MINIKISTRILFFWVLLIPININAWDNEIVHPILSEAATKKSFINTNYVKEYLKINNGVQENINGLKLIEWVRDGSKLEDKFPRFLNHFHNPINPIGSWDTAGLDDFLFSGQSSVLWAQDSTAQQDAAGGDWSWQKTRKYFYDSLTTIDPLARDEFFSNALLGLGHQIHLLQDMSVPAHVRNDAHPLSYNAGGAPTIEKWAARTQK